MTTTSATASILTHLLHHHTQGDIPKEIETNKLGASLLATSLAVPPSSESAHLAAIIKKASSGPPISCDKTAVLITRHLYHCGGGDH